MCGVGVVNHEPAGPFSGLYCCWTVRALGNFQGFNYFCFCLRLCRWHMGSTVKKTLASESDNVFP